MKMKRAACLVAAGLLLSLPAGAHTPQQPPHQLFGEGDLKLESGETIKDFSISYVTHGTLNAKKSNAILMVTAISGNHHRLDFMIGPGKALDTDKYFIVCTDAIANGFSTSPSNSKAQPRMSFPKFAIRDMVESQYRLMKENSASTMSSPWSARRWAACRCCNGASAIPTTWMRWWRW